MCSLSVQWLIHTQVAVHAQVPADADCKMRMRARARARLRNASSMRPCNPCMPLCFSWHVACFFLAAWRLLLFCVSVLRMRERLGERTCSKRTCCMCARTL
eukprot:Tamp_29345.p1 GENE.Tamp_29345~~Tamp_29345.p1  ORF type:complete len:101 (-),score=13.18 Tamp_29345:424-726(-)